MSQTPQALRALAREIFQDDVAEAIERDIDLEVASETMQPPAVAAGAKLFSFKTLWLGDRKYDELGVGRFDGRINLSWEGMDNFIFHPDPNNPFRYTTSTGRVIEPRLMTTDGGSTPRVLRGLSKKLSPWSYAPAFVIHDWLFVSHKCGVAPDNNLSLRDSAIVMAEGMKTLMEKGYTNNAGSVAKLKKDEDILYVMYKAVKTSIAEERWNGACSPEDAALLAI